ncbi:putative F-box/LRR-repeat/kelch-repeat protein At1g11620 isoform X3 [Apium graveolens]|uniref:putative F-box/LRR-repeat/kelch-repeat protein At1g11620 isoform X3 n=1 Tax=Apium graveolens TaxID=4045 RepID=UPI003D7BB141
MAILNDLTDPLVSKILSTLPVKSLMQCICVCKSWYNIVSDPYFIRLHLSLKSADEKEYLVIRFLRVFFMTDHFSFRCNETLVEKSKVKCPIPEFRRGCRIAGCCNGLLLIVNLDHSDMHLWNPSLGKIKPLPGVHGTYNKFNYRLEALGLAFLPDVCDYIVIRILNYLSVDFSVAEIYSLRTDCWRRIETPVERLIPRSDCPLSAAFVYPFFYWVGAENHNNIVSFNLECETFKATSFPDAFLYYGKLVGHLVLFQESLYLFTFCSSDGNSLQMLKENDGSGVSFLKICSFPDGFPIGFMKNGDVIVLDMENKVSLLDPRNVSSPRSTEYELCWERIYNYSPSLALLDKELEGISQTIL